MPAYYQGFVRDRIIRKYAYNWSAFSSNKASYKIAEKLGGIVVEGKNLIMEAMYVVGVNIDSVDGEEIPKTVTYEIKRRNS